MLTESVRLERRLFCATYATGCRKDEMPFTEKRRPPLRDR
jgi:hypothetical protein